MSTPAAFFLPTSGGAFLATELTRGPWNPAFQHGGPPAALLAGAVTRLSTQHGPAHIARITVEFVRPVPVAEVEVRAEVVRAGKRVQTFVATMRAGGQEVARAWALAIRVSRLEGIPETAADKGDFPQPESCPPLVLPFELSYRGYKDGIDGRVAAGVIGEGPVSAWIRMRYPLVDGEAPLPLERVLVAADSGNGISPVLDSKRFGFQNPDLTVYLSRPLAGEWVRLDAATTVAAEGVGLADTRLSDLSGPIGRGVQCLLVEPAPRA